jgi:hypothetical protein
MNINNILVIDNWGFSKSIIKTEFYFNLRYYTSSSISDIEIINSGLICVVV